MVLVCGLGQVGFHVADLLAQAGTEVSVLTLDPREEFSQQLIPKGVRIFSGDARADRSLVEAGLTEADVVIACTDNDLTNLEIALDARKLNPRARIVGRLFDQGLAKRLEQSGIVDRAFGMSAIAAPAFAAAALGTEVVGQFIWEGQTYAVRSIDGGQAIEGTDLWVAPIGSGTNKPHPTRGVLDALSFPKRLWANAPSQLKAISFGIFALTILSVVVFQVGMNLKWEDALYFVVTTVTTTGYGDITPADSGLWLKLYGCLLMLMGSASVATVHSLITDYIVSERFNQVLGRQQVFQNEHVIVAGLGNVGFRTVRQLIALGASVVVIDSQSNPEYRGFLDKGTVFLVGDARDTSTLSLAAVERAIAIVAATDDDTINVSISLAAKELNPTCRAITRLFDQRFAAKVQSAMDIDVALSAPRIAAPKFVGSALEPNSLFSFVYRQKLVSILPPVEAKQGFRVAAKALQPTAS